MVQIRIIFILAIVCQHFLLLAQQPVKSPNLIPEDFCISQAEMQLYRMINDYRKRYALPPIPLSKSLSYVAASHLKDLFFNHPDQEPCNSYSWSDKGPWKAFCYPADENKKNSVWDKPREFTPYKGKGYEIIYWENSNAIPDSIIAIWKSIDYVKNYLLNTGKWQGKKWNSIGIGIYENYACAWFGELADPAGPVLSCGNIPVHATADTTKPDKKEKVATGTYYIIIKSNIPMETASKMIPKLISEGFPLAKVLEKDGKARISVYESLNKTETLVQLREIKKKYKNAWLLKN